MNANLANLAAWQKEIRSIPHTTQTLTQKRSSRSLADFVCLTQLHLKAPRRLLASVKYAPFIRTQAINHVCICKINIPVLQDTTRG